MMDAVGYIALLLNLYSMSVRGERRLRTISLVANLIYIGYGILLRATPIIVGCTVAVLLHLYRLFTMKNSIYDDNTIG